MFFWGYDSGKEFFIHKLEKVGHFVTQMSNNREIFRRILLWNEAADVTIW